MPTIREQVDPNNTLPQVELRSVSVHAYQKTGATEELEEIVLDGEPVGACQITTEKDTTGEFKSHFDEIHIDDDKTGRGIGLAAYLLAIERAQERGIAFENDDNNLSSEAKRIWELLAARGVAQAIKPFGPHSRWADKYEGKYRIPPRSE